MHKRQMPQSYTAIPLQRGLLQRQKTVSELRQEQHNPVSAANNNAVLPAAGKQQRQGQISAGKIRTASS